MTPHPTAELAYLTAPEPSVLLFNLKAKLSMDENGFARIALTRGQLAGIVLEGMKYLLERNN